MEAVDIDTRSTLLQQDRASLLSYLSSWNDRYFVADTNSFQCGLCVFRPSILVSYSRTTNPVDSYVIIVDTEEKRVLRVDDIDLANLEENVILDLNDDGSRWEGNTLEGVQFGWGKRYDSDGNLCYEGFCFDGKNECYGISYYDYGGIEYIGHFVNSMRFGMGTMYDRLNKVVCEGIWIGDVAQPDNRLCITQNIAGQYTIHSSITHLSFDRCCLFKKEHSLVLDGFPRLQDVVFGKYSFGERNSEIKQRCIIQNCAALRRICFKSFSFYSCNELRLERDNTCTL